MKAYLECKNISWSPDPHWVYSPVRPYMLDVNPDHQKKFADVLFQGFNVPKSRFQKLGMYNVRFIPNLSLFPMGSNSSKCPSTDALPAPHRLGLL